MPEQLVHGLVECKRHQADRRQTNLRSMFYALFMSRRRSVRRQNEAVCYYADQYGPYVFAAAMLLILFCILDAFFTLQLLQYGSTELNPILAWALSKHVLFFFVLKYSLTAVCVIVSVQHKHFRVFGLKGYHFLASCILGYAVLIHYQLAMLSPVLF